MSRPALCFGILGGMTSFITLYVDPGAESRYGGKRALVQGPEKEIAVTIPLTPEHERIIEAQLASGQFRSVDEVLDQALAPFRSAVLPELSEEERKVKAPAAAERIRELSRVSRSTGHQGCRCANMPTSATNTDGCYRARCVGLHAMVLRR
jgi:Arc/MetJ-type ribon-helix-helix transcriptional regulator